MAKETNIPPFMAKSLNSFKNFKFPGFNNEILLSSYQKNIEWMNETQKIATQAAQSLMELQTQNSQKVINHYNEQSKCSFSNAPLEEKTALHAETAKTTVDEIVQHLHDVNAIATQSTEQIMGSFQKRCKEGLDECLYIVKKKQE